MAQQQREESPQQTINLLWGMRTASSRGPKATLTVEKIAAAAVQVADANGIDAVSMQGVAESLDFTKMSLYRHVSGKADLVAVMIEHAVGDPPDRHRVKGGWRPRIERWARALSKTWEQHPWLPGVTVGDRMMGPKEIGWVEAGVAAMDRTPLTPDQRMDVVTTVSGLLRNTQSGNVAGTQPWHSERHAQLIHDHGDGLPALSQVVAGARSRVPRKARDFGLRCFLDGLEFQIQHLAER